MNFRPSPITAGITAALFPGTAAAHDAFGELGSFYAALLHPLADPAQGLVLAAAAVFLARQPLASVRPAFAALALAGTLAIPLGMLGIFSQPGLAITALAAAALGVVALTGASLGRWPTITIAVCAALTAGLAIDLPPGVGAGSLAAIGGALGIALGTLLVWGLVDLLQSRIGRVAGAVASSWIAAVAVMAATLALVSP